MYIDVPAISVGSVFCRRSGIAASDPGSQSTCVMLKIAHDEEQCCVRLGPQPCSFIKQCVVG